MQANLILAMRAILDVLAAQQQYWPPWQPGPPLPPGRAAGVVSGRAVSG